MNMKIATFEDLGIVAECHILAFPHTLSAKLGKKFVMKSMECYIKDENKFLIFIEEDGVCAGYVNAIIPQPGSIGSASSMLQSAFIQAFLSGISRPWLIFHPEIRAKFPLIWKNIKWKLFGNKPRLKSDKKHQNNYSVGLPGMCVHPNHRRKGYATKLMLEAERIAYERGFRHLYCTVLTTNSSTTDCHTKLGYKIVKRTANFVQMEKVLDY